MEDNAGIIVLSDEEDSPKPGCSSDTQSKIIPSGSCMPAKNSMSRARTLFTEFLEKCKSEDDTNDMKLIINKMWMKYENSDPVYRHSSSFSTFLKNMMQRHNEPYAVLKDVSDELKNNKRSSNNSSSRKHKTSKNGNENTMDPKTSKHLSKLYKTLFSLSKKIEKLRKTELTLSEDEDSAYIMQDRYERRFTKVYNKICEIINQPNHAGRITLKDISFKGTEYKVLNRCIERYYNKERIVPDFMDIRNIVQTVNNSNKEGVMIQDIHNTASDAFRKFLDSIIKRRCYDDYMLANDYISGTKDPADDDQELRKKLEANRGKLQKDVTQVIDDYAKKQTDLHLKSSETDEDEEEVESEDEDLEEGTEEEVLEEESEASNLDEFLDINISDDNHDSTEVNDIRVEERNEALNIDELENINISDDDDNTEVNDRRVEEGSEASNIDQLENINISDDDDNTEVNDKKVVEGSEASTIDELLNINISDDDDSEVNDGGDSRISEDEELSTKQCSVVIDDVKYTISCKETEIENSSKEQVPEMVEVSCKRKSSILNTNVSKKAKMDTDEEENAILADNYTDDSQPIEDPLQIKNGEYNGEMRDETYMSNNEEVLEIERNYEEEGNRNDKGEQEIERMFQLLEGNPEEAPTTFDVDREENGKQNEVNESPVNRNVYDTERSDLGLVPDVEDNSIKVKDSMVTEEVNEENEEQNDEKDMVNEEEENVERSKSEDDVMVIAEYNTARKNNDKQQKQSEEEVIDVESIPEEKRGSDVTTHFDVNQFIRSIGIDLTANNGNATDRNQNVPTRQPPALPPALDRFSTRNTIRPQSNVKKNFFPLPNRFPSSNNLKTIEYLTGLNRRREVTIRPVLTRYPVRHSTPKPVSRLPSYQQNIRGVPQASSSRAGRSQSISSTISQIQQSQSSYRNPQSGDRENSCVQTLKEVTTRTTSNGQVLTSTYTTVLHQSVQNINKSKKRVVPSKDTGTSAPVRKKIYKLPPADVEVITIE